MLGLTQLVDDSLARHGLETNLDHRRLQWAEWFRCESAFSCLRVPDKAGVFVLAEEVIAPGETAATGGKRMLAIYHISETDDLGLAIGRLFLRAGSVRERLTSGCVFARYAVIEDAAQRRSAYAALQQWTSSSADAAFGAAGARQGDDSSNNEAPIGVTRQGSSEGAA